MTKYMLGIEIKAGEVEEILKELTEAQEKIRDCYYRLSDMGVLTISEAGKTTPET